MTSGDHPREPMTGPPVVGHARIARYEVRVRGRLGPRSAVGFDGLDLVVQPDGTTLIRVPEVDQAALHGLLHQLRDVGIPLVSLTELPADTSPSRTTRTQTATPNPIPGATP